MSATASTPSKPGATQALPSTHAKLLESAPFLCLNLGGCAPTQPWKSSWPSAELSLQSLDRWGAGACGLVAGYLEDRGGEVVRGGVHALGDGAGRIAHRLGDLAPAQALEDLGSVGQQVANLDISVGDVDEGYVSAGVVPLEQRLLPLRRCLQRDVADIRRGGIAFTVVLRLLDRGKRQVLARVLRSEEGPARDVGRRVGGGGVNGAEPGEGTEPAQRDDHRPPLRRAVRAVVRPYVEQFRLAARGEQLPADRGNVVAARRVDAADAAVVDRARADLIQDASRNGRDVPDHAGQRRPGRAVACCRRGARLGIRLDQSECEHHRDHRDNAPGREQYPAAGLGPPGRGALRGDLLAAAGTPFVLAGCPHAARVTFRPERTNDSGASRGIREKTLSSHYARDPESAEETHGPTRRSPAGAGRLRRRARRRQAAADGRGHAVYGVDCRRPDRACHRRQ